MREKFMTQVYHYTKGYNLAGILNTGFIKRELEAGVVNEASKLFFYISKASKKVWLTTETEMPFTATPRILDGKGIAPFTRLQRRPNRSYAAWHELCGGVYRFSFYKQDIDAVRYIDSPARNQLKNSGMLINFENVAKMRNDDLSKWYYSENPIDISLSIGIDVWHPQNQWQSSGIRIPINNHNNTQHKFVCAN